MSFGAQFRDGGGSVSGARSVARRGVRFRRRGRLAFGMLQGDYYTTRVIRRVLLLVLRVLLVLQYYYDQYDQHE